MVFWGINKFAKTPNTPIFTGMYYEGKKVYYFYLQQDNIRVGYTREYVIDTGVIDLLSDQVMWNSTTSTDWKLFPISSTDPTNNINISLGIQSGGEYVGRLRVVGVNSASIGNYNLKGSIYYTKED